MISGFYATLPPHVAYKYDKGGLHFVQAHHLMGADDGVKAWYRKRGLESRGGHYTVLDNGACELGNGDMSMLRQAAYTILPNAVVVPDVFQNSALTMDSFRECVEECIDLAPEIMVVPQGLTLMEWCLCAAHMNDHLRELGYGRAIVGIPKVVETYYGGRTAAALWMKYNHLFQGRSIHALGVWYTMGEIWQLVERGLIHSFDTTLPYACAMSSKIMGRREGKVDMQDGWWLDDPVRLQSLYLQVNLATAEEVFHAAKSSAR